MKTTNIFLILISVLTTSVTVGQETKKVKNEIEATYTSEVYYVLKSDNNVKHGNYQELGYKGCVIINGYYKDNKKDSIWTAYFYRTKMVESQGRYRNDKKEGTWAEYYNVDDKSVLKSKGEYVDDQKVGIWEFYDSKSELLQKYDFDNNKLIYFKPDEKEYEVKTESGVLKTKLDNPLLYIGGINTVFNLVISKNLKYPEKAIEKGTTGKVIISFYVDTTGKAFDYKIESGIGDGCDEEALRIVKLIPNNWIPAKLNGQAVEAKYFFPINFAMN
jgi:protein TonB